MWLTIIMAVIPLLAIPIWLMKAAIIILALVMAALVYFNTKKPTDSEDDSQSEPPTGQPSVKPTPKQPKASSKKPDDDSDPVDITDPKADSFVATNTYKSRSKRLGK